MSVFSPPHRRKHFHRAAVMLLALVTVAGCHRAAGPHGTKVVEVVVTAPTRGEVTEYQDFTGRLEALKTVDMRPRVSGYVEVAPPAEMEGKPIHKGDVLFKIDPSTYQADLNLAEAELRQAEAERKLQVKNAERARQLIGSGSINKEEFDQILANRDKAIAAVGSKKAALDRARLYLGYTTITAPLDGRLGRRQVDPGNLVNADQTVLTTIVTEDPVYAYFDVDERTYLQLVSVTSSASSSWLSALNFPVMMRLAHEDDFAQVGSVNFLDNRLNANTGTVRMRGVFNNPKSYLKSGLFVRIRLPLGTPYKTWLIPDEAVQNDQGRKCIYVVQTEKDEQGNEIERVKYRAVTLGPSLQGLRVIKEADKDDEGLKGGERVIVEGMQRVRPGAAVQLKTREAAKAPRAPLTELLSSQKLSLNDKDN